MKKRNLLKKWIVCLAITTALNVFGDVEWRKDYESAMAEAKETSRPVFILFTNTKSCPYCIEGDKLIFSQSSFQRFSKKYVIPLKVDYAPLFGGDKKTTGADFKQLQEQFKIPADMKTGGWPYVVLVAPDGTILHQETERTIRDPHEFVDKYKDLAAALKIKPTD